MVIPVDLRRELGLKSGQRLFAHKEGESIVLESKKALLARLRERLPKDTDVVADLIAERRQEAASGK